MRYYVAKKIYYLIIKWNESGNKKKHEVRKENAGDIL